RSAFRPAAPYADALEEQRRLAQGQAHHARVASRQVLDEDRADPLDAVSAGLVERLAGRTISASFLVRRRAESHFADVERRVDAVSRTYGHAREHSMNAPRARFEHLERVGLGCGLTENSAVEHDRGVGGDDRHGSDLGPYGFGLRFRETRDITLRRLAVEDGFVDLGDADDVPHADLREQCAAAWR